VSDTRPVLVTGATGYVGGRLVPLLLERGHVVRAVGRSAGKLRCRPWGAHPNIQFAEADLADSEALTRAVEGCQAAFYLVHSMGRGKGDFAASDRRAAYNMVQAAKRTGLERIIYLSGLGDAADDLSEHLRSRAETGEILKLGPAAVTVLRAAVILGSGSASFEILRGLAENLPVMLTPRWVRTKSQPIAISNVLGYLAGCLEHPETAGRDFDIGGPDILSYQELIQLYAKVAGLRRRLIIPVPALSPRLSSWWLKLCTPVSMSLVRPLVDGLRNECVVRDPAIREIIPQELLSCREAMTLALDKVRQNQVDTCWSDAGLATHAEWTQCGDPSYAGGRELQCGYRAMIEAAPEDIWPHVARIGGKNGWYAGNTLWRLRGLLDQIVAGPGLSRGRRHPEELREGDALDFFRVLKVEPPARLLLHSEMRVPGDAFLEFHVERISRNATELTLLARFLPRGVAGLAYWYSIYPLHHAVFGGMIEGLARATGKTLLEGPRRYTKILKNACGILTKE